MQIAFSSKNRSNSVEKAAAKLKVAVANAEGHHFSVSNQTEGIAIEASVDFDGNDHPKRPDLTYYKDESDIQNLIAMRLNNANSIRKKTYSFKYSRTSGIKIDDAVKIEGALKKMKCTASGSLAQEAKNENDITLWYTIEF